MAGHDDTRYNLALVASTISSLGWLGALGAFGYAAYLFVTGQPAATVAGIGLISMLVGIAFARIEKRLYETDVSWL